MAERVACAFFWRRPLVGVLELGASPEAVGVARQYVRASLGEWACPFGVREDMELICSELVSNAVQATRSLQALPLAESWPVGLRLFGNRQRVLLEVWDCHPGVPVRRVAPDEAEGGRGLAIVHELADHWGSRRLTARVKAVWAELLLPAPTVHPGETIQEKGGAR
ncbi:MAG: ATP-binding protein [Actinomycetia bacterium]|nr:ATP-binding protein [Actinomycetes bacterium]